MKWLLAILGVIAGILGWLFRGVFASNTERQLKAERDIAKTSSAQQTIKANAKEQEVILKTEQQKREDEINAADNNSTASQLDDLFKQRL